MSLSTGVRRLSRSALAARELARGRNADVAVSRRELSAAAREASQALRLRTGARVVLFELVGAYGEQDLARGLIVWPSNAYLETRTGLCERAIRYAIRDLVELRLLAPADSANRKRFARRDRDGVIIDAFGFDMAPLIVRRGEFEAEIRRQAVEREILDLLFDRATMARKAIEETLRHLKDPDLEGEFAELLSALPRRGRGDASLEPLVRRLEDLRSRVEKAFYDSTLDQEDAGSPGSSCRLIESNNGSVRNPCKQGSSGMEVDPSGDLDLALVLAACPALAEYVGEVREPGELVMAGRRLRPTIGAHETAWTEAVDKIGPMRAALAVILVLQIYSDDQESGARRIANPGGFFRSITRRIATGEFDLTAELRALVRRRMVT